MAAKTFTVSVTKKEEVSFESPYSDAEAVEKLTALFKESKITSKFASSLVSQKRLSDKQTAWVHKLVIEHDAKQPKTPASSAGSSTYTVSTVDAKDVSFESPYSTAEALEKLTQYFKESKVTSSFAASLITKKYLSEKQASWVHKIVLDTEACMFPKIAALFDKAVEHVKQPKLVVELPTIFVILRRDTLGNLQDTIQVDNLTSSTHGFIDASGFYRSKGKLDTDTLNLLKQLNDDPVNYATTYGKLSGRCCFCHLPLTHATSLSVGYGAKCASNYALPYGVPPPCDGIKKSKNNSPVISDAEDDFVEIVQHSA
jgi:hypothetical protein